MSATVGVKMFVAGLTSEVNENDLKTLFQECGEILETKVVRSTTGESKGYGFVVFGTEEIAKSAQKTFQGREFKGKKLDIKSTKSNACLYIKGIRKEWSPEMTESKMKLLFTGVTKVSYIEDKTITGHNRGYCFVFFESKKTAMKTLGDIQQGMYSIEGSRLTGGWADSQSDENDDVYLKKSICIRNLPKGVGEEDLKAIFAKYGEIESIRLGRNLKTNPREDISFINYLNEGPAEQAVSECQGIEIMGNKIEVVINKKNDNKGKNQRKLMMQTPMANGIFNPYYPMSNTQMTARYPMVQPNIMGVSMVSDPNNNSKQYYKTRLCKMFKQNGSCSKGIDCPYAHGEKELRDPSMNVSQPTYQTYTNTVNSQVSNHTQNQTATPLQTSQSSSVYPLKSTQGGPTYPQITSPVVSPYPNTNYDYSLYNNTYQNQLNTYPRTQQTPYTTVPTVPTDTYAYQTFH